MVNVGSKQAFLLVLLLFFVSNVGGQTIQYQWLGLNSLLPRSLHWSGVCSYDSKIYVFGGNEKSREVSTTYIYDPTTNKWSAGANMPTGRYLCTAVEVGGKIYVMGGRQLVASTNPVNVNECYDPATNTWQTKAPMPQAIRGHGATAINNKIYVLGGNTGIYTDAVYIYDTNTNNWSNGPTMPVKAGYGGAVYSSLTNSIYWVGGVKSSTSSSTNYIGKVYKLDISSNLWDSGVLMPYKTAYFGCAIDSSGQSIYVCSGNYWEPYYGELSFPAIQVFDTVTGRFNSTFIYMPSPQNREYGSAIFCDQRLWLLQGYGVRVIDDYEPNSKTWYLPNQSLSYEGDEMFIAGATGGVINNKFYVVEGASNDINGAVYEYDPSLNAWSKKDGVDPDPRSYVSGGVWGDNIVIYGGVDIAWILNKTAVLYNPSSDTFTNIGGQNPRPTFCEASAIYNNKLYLFGGRTNPDDQNSICNYTNILDLNTGIWSTGANMPIAVQQSSASVYNNKIYIFGGFDNVGPDYVSNKVIIYDPATNSFTYGPDMGINEQSYSSFSIRYGNYILVDAGYNLYYDDLLSGLSGGVLDSILVFNPSNNTFLSTIPRPFGKENHISGIIGTKYYSTTGIDPDWPVSRLDIANLNGIVCYVSCSTYSNPTSGSAPLIVNFKGITRSDGCNGTPSYSWDFGDGVFSSEQNPSHTYQFCGNYQWTSTISLQGQTCVRSGTINVGSGCISYDSHSNFTEVTGNGDSYFEKGEKWKVSVTVRNSGNTPATNVVANLTGNGIQVCNNPGVFGTISAGGTGSYEFEFLIDSNFSPCGGYIDFGLINKQCVEKTPAGSDEFNLFSIQVGEITSGVPTELVIQPSSIDSWVNQASQNGNYGSDTSIYVQARNLQARRLLVQFDLSSIPLNSTINSATLELYATSTTGSNTIELHRITSSWSEGSVTWESQPSFDSSATSTLSGINSTGWKVWDVKSLIEGYLSGTFTNCGFLLKSQTETGAQLISTTFASRENSNTSQRPVLRINYTPPPAMSCNYVGNGECLIPLPGEVAPGDNYNNALIWSEDKATINWPAVSGVTSYKVYRGIKSSLPALLTSAIDSCLRYQDTTTSVDLSSDNPSSDSDKMYWYLIVGSNSSGDGPAGNGRIVNSGGSCQ